MARGWESKSVDDQIADAEARVFEKTRAALTADQRDRATRRDGLLLARTRALQDLQLACDRRHRALLERTLEHLDGELARLDDPR